MLATPAARRDHPPAGGVEAALEPGVVHRRQAGLAEVAGDVAASRHHVQRAAPEPEEGGGEEEEQRGRVGR